MTEKTKVANFNVFVAAAAVSAAAAIEEGLDLNESAKVLETVAQRRAGHRRQRPHLHHGYGDRRYIFFVRRDGGSIPTLICLNKPPMHVLGSAQQLKIE